MSGQSIGPTDGEPKGLWVPPLIWDVISSTAATHSPTCDCLVCRAVAGDASAAEQAIRLALGLS